MTDHGGRDMQLHAIWADQQAQEILLRALLKASASRSDAECAALLARIDLEARRFADTATDPSWRQSVTAIVNSVVEDLREELEQAPAD